MIYSDFQGEALSLLGFGTMRLPTLEGGAIDETQVNEMVRYALEHGVNYFDTAYPYHGGQSEIVVGRALNQYPRDSWHLASKYPGHQIASSYDPEGVFEEQLKKCGVEYFDFYLLHNVYEKSIETYLDPKWGIIDYFKEQKRLGRIKHLGFSTHASIGALEKFLNACGADMEFCQIQLNWLDWTLQQAKKRWSCWQSTIYPCGSWSPCAADACASWRRRMKNAFAPCVPAKTWPHGDCAFCRAFPMFR